MSDVGPVLSLLREETGEVHRRLEERMDAVGRLSEADSRDELVRRYHLYHSTLEAAVAAATGDVPLPDWRRAPLIEEAMALLDLIPLPDAASPALFNRQQAFGALYVLEGSALGGRMILKDLARRGVDCRGLAFLDPHGEAAGESWRTFVGVLEREVADPKEAAIGASLAFCHAEHVLCREVAA